MNTNKVPKIQMRLFQRIWCFIKYHARGTSFFQILLLCISIHTFISVLIVYWHINLFDQETEGRFKPPNLYEKKGGIMLKDRIDEINLVVSDVIGEKSVSYHGWWFDHHRFDVDIQCFNAKWAKCVKVFSSECKPDSVRAIYQFIPIKQGFPLSSIEIKLKATSTNLIEQSEFASIGLHAMILLTSGETDNVAVEFPPELEQWTDRSFSYSSKPGTWIVEISIMLMCTGYNGQVFFTDIYVIPKNKLKINQKREDIVAVCAHEAYEDRPLKAEDKTHVVYPDFFKPTDKPVNSQITLATHVSMDRISVLDKTLRTWPGPVSLAICIPALNGSQELRDWQTVYLEKKLRNLDLASGSKIVFVLGTSDHYLYPINKLRNLAMKNAQTKFVMIIDADFQPSPNLEKNFHSIYNQTIGSKKAFVVPAFEYHELPNSHDEMPHYKEELVQLIFREDPLVSPFRMTESVDAHRLTNYWKWFSANQVYKIASFSDKYEPYLIIEKTDGLPLFDERFAGYGMNKVSFITELYIAGYDFYVLPKSWVIHYPHKASTCNQGFLQSSQQRLYNRFQRFQFVKNIIRKYNLKQEFCFDQNS